MRRALRSRPLVPVVLATLVFGGSAGCRDSYDSRDTDGGSTTANDEGESSGTDGGEGESLLQNGDFELWAGGAAPGWIPSGDAVLAQLTDEPHGGDSAATLTGGPAYSSLVSNILVPQGVPEGSLVTIRGWTKHISGVGIVGIDIYLQNSVSGDEMTLPFTGFAAPNSSWTMGESGIVLPFEVDSMRLDIGYGGEGITVGLDDFELVVTPPG